MRTSTPILLASILALCGAATVSAQSNGSIEGNITIPDGDPAGSVTVSVKGTNRRATTGKDGSYLLNDLAEGRYTIVAARIGLISQEKEITVAAGRTVRADFVMAERAFQMDEVTVSADKSPNERPVAIGKVAIAPMDLPQSVAVVDQAVIEQQQALHLSDVLKNVNGVYQMGNTGGTQEEIAGRGFSFGSSNTFKNGVRFNNSVMPEVSALERMEVIKGSSAILFGNVAAGGVINLVTKKPRFTHGGNVAMRVGSYSLYKPSADVYGPIAEDVAAYRLNATYENAGSFRDSVNSERIYVNPSFLINAGSRTEILLEGDYLKDDRTTDYGTGAINYSIADVPRNRFLGAPWSYYKANQASATLTATHYLTDSWQIRGVGGYQNYKNDLFSTTRPNASSNFVQTDGKWVRGVQRTEVNEQYYVGQIDLSGDLATGFLTHKLLVGVDADKYNTKTTAYDGVAKYDSINIFDPAKYSSRSDLPTVKPRTLTTSPVSRAGVYVQDLIGITEQIKLLAGVRWSYQETASEVFTHATNATVTNKSYDDAITPRFGLVYQPMNNLSLFASYSNSFTLNTGVDVDGNALPPSYINQYEAGVKSDLFEGILSANLTAYQIVNSNLAQTSLANGNTNANIKELAGEVKSQGVELDVMSRPYNGLSLIAGYSYNMTKYTKSNIYIEGSELRYNPHHTLNASADYTFRTSDWTNGLSVGASALYFGERVAGRSTRLTIPNDSYKLMPVPAFTQVDVMAGYRFGNLALRLKVANLFDALSYHVHDDNSVNPIAPRTFSVSTSYDL